ncbi:MAG: acetyl-CoA carboxylase carboxyl transferase subunit beta [SAR202 cluster bacterium]|nr:acetyl-CoA carboxylase carboxyl transferase subunit beta [SAR202 cluster bacterium]
MVRKLSRLLRILLSSNEAQTQIHQADIDLRESCLVCGIVLIDSPLYKQFRVCPGCKFHYGLSARDRIHSLVDPGSFKEINRSIAAIDPTSSSSKSTYNARFSADQRRTGLYEAIVTGVCSIGGSSATLIVLDFGFMGGSISSVVGEKAALAFEHAAKRKLPVVAVLTSGGSRVNEGLLSLLQMGKITVSSERFSEKKLPLISVLANPTTGQAFASLANLADITLAEPGAIIGFSTARAIKESGTRSNQLTISNAESQLSNGMIDTIIDRTELNETLATLLDLTNPEFRLSYRKKTKRNQTPLPKQRAWQSVGLARHTKRPTSIDYINRIVLNFFELKGDRASGEDPAIVGGLGHLGGQTVMIIGQERGGENNDALNDGMTSPAGFRKAVRLMKLAEKFEIPVITLIDTPGPNQGAPSEIGGLGSSIASTMSVMASLNVPTIAAIIGQGGSEGALALAIADRVLMMQNAIYTAMAPEEAADLMFDKSTSNEEVAESLRLTAADCLELNMVDEIVGEPITAAHESPDAAARQLRRIILTHLTDIGNWSNFRRSRRRYRKFRQIGEFTKNISALNELDPRSNDLTKLSKSKGPKVSDIKFRFQETDSLEKIDPYDHIHQTPED